MAKFANPRKKFNWSIQITPEPINPFLFQKVTVPSIEVEQDKHGDTNHDIKTAGRVDYSNLTAEKLMPSDSSDTYMWAWIDSCQSSIIGGGLPPDLYKKNIEVTEFAEDGATPLNRWICVGIWPQKVNGLELDRATSGNTIESVEFSVDQMQKI